MDDLIAWLPLLVIFAVLAVFMVLAIRQSRSYGRHVDRVHSINDEILTTNREMISELREIKELLRDRR